MLLLAVVLAAEEASAVNPTTITGVAAALLALVALVVRSQLATDKEGRDRLDKTTAAFVASLETRVKSAEDREAATTALLEKERGYRWKDIEEAKKREAVLLAQIDELRTRLEQ
jgi:hypothetical protein